MGEVADRFCRPEAVISFFGSPEWRPGKLQDLVFLQRGFDITKAEQKDGSVPVFSSSGPNSFHDVPKVEGPGVIIGRKGTLGSTFYCEGSYWPHDTSNYPPLGHAAF